MATITERSKATTILVAKSKSLQRRKIKKTTTAAKIKANKTVIFSVELSATVLDDGPKQSMAAVMVPRTTLRIIPFEVCCGGSNNIEKTTPMIINMSDIWKPTPDRLKTSTIPRWKKAADIPTINAANK